MRKLSIAVTAAVILMSLLLPLSAVYAETNLLSNPGFEDGRGGNPLSGFSWIPWSGSSYPDSGGGSVTYERINGQLKHSGYNSAIVYLYSQSTQPRDAWAGFSQQVPVTAGTVYKGSGWLRYSASDTLSNDTVAYLKLEWSGNYTSAITSAFLTSGCYSPNKWHYFSFIGIAPPGATAASFSVVEYSPTNAAHPGKIYADDLSLVAVAQSPQIFVDDFNSYYQHTNALNDLGYWTGGDLGPGGYDVVIGDSDLELRWTKASAWWVSVLKSSSPYLDIRGYFNISFDAKGINGGEKFSIALEDSIGQKGIVPLINYLPNGLTTSYTNISIPISAFTNATPSLNLSQIKQIVLINFASTTGTIRLDNIIIGQPLAGGISNVSVTNISDCSATINFTTPTPTIGRVEYAGSAAPGIFNGPAPSPDYVRGVVYDPYDSDYDDTYVSDFPEIAKYFKAINIYGQENFGNNIFDELNKNGLKLVFRVERYNTATSPAALQVDDFSSLTQYMPDSKNDLGYWTGGGDLGSGGYHQVNNDNVLEIHWAPNNGTGWWVTFLKDSPPYFDSTPYYSISFDIWAPDGGEFIKIALDDGNGNRAIVPVENYYMPNGLTPYKLHIEVPFYDFAKANPNLNMSQIKSFLFLFSDGRSPSGTMYVDNIFLEGKMVFDYRPQDADWVIEHYRNALTYVSTTYPNQVLYYEINIPMDNEKLNIPSFEKQRDYIAYLAGRIKNEFDSTKPIYINLYHGYKDELLQTPAKDISNVDGFTLVVYPMHWDGVIYGDGIPGAVNGTTYVPVHTDTDWLLLMKDQLDYYIHKTLAEDGRPIYVDQIGYAEIYYRDHEWGRGGRYDVNGRVMDNRAKYASIASTRNYLESFYPDIKGWFYFLYYNNNWEGSWGIRHSGYEEETVPTTNHSIKLTKYRVAPPSKSDNLFPDTLYNYNVVVEGSEYQGTFTTSSLSGRESNPLPSITITQPAYANAITDAQRKFEIKWTDSNSRSDARVNLYWDTNDRDRLQDRPWYIPNGTNNLIASINEADPANSYVWDTSSMPAGSYYIYAVLENGGVNKEVVDYSCGQVVVSNQYIYAPRLSETDPKIVIDGSPSDAVWSKTQWFRFATHPSANGNSTADVKVLWDWEAIYFLFRVYDTKVETSASNHRNDDSIHVSINNGAIVGESYAGVNTTYLGVSGNGEGSPYRAFSLMPGTTIDNNSDTDQGYYVEMKMKWVDMTRIMPYSGVIVPIDLISVDHDNNPGGNWNDPATVFSKISFDGDGLAETTGRSVILTTLGSISGLTTLQNRTNNSSLITFELRNPGQTTPISTYQVTTAANGSYLLTDIVPGTYDVTAKGSNFLRAKQINITVSPGQQTPNINFSLRGGDANGDNVVSGTDLAIWQAAYGTKPGNPKWDPRADFNGNSQIDGMDFSILRSNYGKSGAP